ncbi:MAPEG family protein [Thalassotalea sediminis]|uniref:MAPEG family protein n=1 Tax=Thalassotalea sediminis TaxID=1759089 RepID=UPI002572544E|nr:MAPEG family protein [Thalassotalea sediminis]
MLNVSITGFYLALLALLYIGFTIRIIKLRYKYKTGIGDGGHDELAQAVRVHGNFAEYTPLAMLMLACAEINGSTEMLVYAVGALFFIGRILHSIGITQTQGPSKSRQIGMLASFLTLLILAVENIRLFVS